MGAAVPRLESPLVEIEVEISYVFDEVLLRADCATALRDPRIHLRNLLLRAFPFQNACIWK
jgi:hypothetical protein